MAAPHRITRLLIESDTSIHDRGAMMGFHVTCSCGVTVEVPHLSDNGEGWGGHARRISDAFVAQAHPPVPPAQLLPLFPERAA